MAYDYGVTETGWGWGAAFVDLDLDGRLELYAVQGFDEFVDIYSRSLFDERAALFVDPGTLPWVRTDDTGCEVEGDQRALLPLDSIAMGTSTCSSPRSGSLSSSSRTARPAGTG